MPFGIGLWEGLILLVVLALLFGAKGVPQAARRLGKGMREVQTAVAEVDPRRMLDDADERNADAPSKPAAATRPKPAPAQQASAPRPKPPEPTDV
jgi:TatA/E family protein of Tat protein translocase